MEMMQLVIAWTCVGVFVATCVITLLALVGVIKLADKKYLDRLFTVLILEVVSVALAFFSGAIKPRNVRPILVENGIRQDEVEKADNVREQIYREMLAGDVHLFRTMFSRFALNVQEDFHFDAASAHDLAEDADLIASDLSVDANRTSFSFGKEAMDPALRSLMLRVRSEFAEPLRLAEGDVASLRPLHEQIRRRSEILWNDINAYIAELDQDPASAEVDDMSRNR